MIKHNMNHLNLEKYLIKILIFYLKKKRFVLNDF